MEFLLAMIITVMAVTMVSQGVDTAGLGTSVAMKQTRAVMLAQRVMVQVETGDLAPNRTDNGDFEPDYPGYTYSMVSDAQEKVGLYLIQIKVSWNERGSERSTTLSRLLWAPSEEQ